MAIIPTKFKPNMPIDFAWPIVWLCFNNSKDIYKYNYLILKPNPKPNLFP
jgi:hypothetical protein